MATTEYDSAAARSLFADEFLELVRYRELLWLLVANSIKTRYRRSVLGIVWTLLNPLLTMLVLTFAFSSLFVVKLPHYPVYLLSGLLLWNFFSQTTVSSMHQLVWGSSLLKRVYIPRTIFAVSATGNGFVNLGLGLVPLATIMLITGHPFYFSTLWFLPIAVLVNGMFALGVALLLSTLAVYFVDVVDMYQILLSALFYLTPIMYPKDILPAKYIWFMNFNPLYNMLEMFRRPLYDGMLPGPYTISAAVVSAIVSLGVGWFVFTKKAEHFAYRT